MRVYPISKKIGVLDNGARENLQVLIKKMESKANTVVNPNGLTCTLNYTTGGALKENGNAVYGGKVCGIVSDASTVVLNNKRYVVSNTTGEILPEKTTWKNCVILSTKKIISGISNVINKVKENFENPEVVNQSSLAIFAVTEKGAKKIEEAQIKAFGHKL